MSCTLGYKRHRFIAPYATHELHCSTCVRCGAPNPRWNVVLLVKPARRPKWWPHNGKSAAWATIHWDGHWVIGYSVGTDRSKAFRRTQVKAATRRWLDEYDYRKWTFKEVPVEPWHE